MAKDDLTAKRLREALQEAYCPKCREWYNVKNEAERHVGH